MVNNINEKFESLLTGYTAAIASSFQNRMKKAKNKPFVFNEIKEEVCLINEMLVKIPEIKDMADVFTKFYSRGETMNFILPFTKEHFGVDKYYEPPIELINNEKEISIYISEELNTLNQIDKEEKKLLLFLIRYTAFQEIQAKLSQILSNENQHPAIDTSKRYSVEWTGNKENKNEFVQLVYALHEAGFLNKGKGEITKIVETLAETLQVGLGRNWQSNHSASIHKSNKVYQPPIFDEIKEAYIKYSDDLILSKKTNK